MDIGVTKKWTLEQQSNGHWSDKEKDNILSQVVLSVNSLKYEKKILAMNRKDSTKAWQMQNEFSPNASNSDRDL
ncbi:hypothetical protein KUTeg_018299 [Tegillarca granosa]|uniref:Uncharacterized protein n=1 Tax=Tegillarca granosa TaxID=220873 RepID=A0ABQ9EHJ4_TEGGR|nr:hypothetical protein KUTeg_018299 [Tegillarca granosa]